MAMVQFYCVVGNRDKIKVVQEDGAVVQTPIWAFLPAQQHWLTSLVYLRSMAIPPGHRIFDCGAWSYKHAAQPRWSPEDCAERYRAVAAPGDVVAAPDHMVLRDHDAETEAYRIDLTLENARRFLACCPEGLVPMAVTHGNSVDARERMTEALLEMGYRAIATGSVAVRAGHRKFLHAVFDATARLREQSPAGFRWHVLGVSALSWVPEFEHYGVDSYDGSSMFFSAFTAGDYDWWDDTQGRLVHYDAREGGSIPVECACPVCATLRRQGVDTRRMGSNEHNMGRAVHNVHVYLQALAAQRPTGSAARQSPLPDLWAAAQAQAQQADQPDDGRDG